MTWLPSESCTLGIILILSVVSLVLSVFETTNQQLIQALFVSTLAFLALSLLKNRRQNEDVTKLVNELRAPLSLSEKFFKHADDINEITQAVCSSQKSFLWGTALVMHIPMLREEIANALDKGKEIRFLLVKPNSSALSMAAFRAKDGDRSELNSNLLHNLNALNAIASGKSVSGKLEIRVIDYFAPYTLYIFDADLPTGWAQARLSSLRVSHTNRPTYRLTRRDDALWYAYHVEQFEKAWELAEPYQPS